MFLKKIYSCFNILSGFFGVKVKVYMKMDKTSWKCSTSQNNLAVSLTCGFLSSAWLVCELDINLPLLCPRRKIASDGPIHGQRNEFTIEKAFVNEYVRIEQNCRIKS